MTVTFGTARELTELLALATELESKMNALQTAIATLTADVSTLSSAVTAGQANQFTPADVANVQAVDTQVKALTAALTPAPATPTPTATG